MPSYVTPKKNTAYKFYVGLIDQSNTKLLKANPTIAAGDFKVSTDGGAFANLTTLPSASPAGGRSVMIDLSAAEMNGDNIAVQCVDAAGAEWCDLLINIQTSTRQVDDLAFPATSGRSMVVDAAGLVDANMVKAGASGAGNTITTSGGVTLPAGTVASTTNITAGTITTTTNLTNLPAITAGWITAAGITAGALNGKGDWLTAAGYTAPTNLTAAQIATGVWQDTTAGDFTVAGSIGKSLFTSGNAPGAASGIALVGSNMGTVSSVTGNVAGNVVGSVGSVTAAVTLPAIPANWITAAGINAAALNGKGDWLLSSGYTAPTNLTAAQIATGVWQDTTAGDFTVVGSVGKRVTDNVDATISSRSTYAGADTAGTTTLLALVGAPAGASVSADIAAVKADTGAIKTTTDKFAFTVANQVDANPLSVNGSSNAAANLARGTLGNVLGTVGVGSTTTSIVTSALDPAASVTDQFKGRIATFDRATTTAALRGQATDITGSTAGGVLTVTALTTAPASTDTFTIT